MVILGLPMIVVDPNRSCLQAAVTATLGNKRSRNNRVRQSNQTNLLQLQRSPSSSSTGMRTHTRRMRHETHFLRRGNNKRGTEKKTYRWKAHAQVPRSPRYTTHNNNNFSIVEAGTSTTPQVPKVSGHGLWGASSCYS
ncbi:hypothetical protein AND_000766 [Anopheles darlingi]|uniref:Uncharacterized protein n=1 Tax=Anopheles darlingi TaxID=43151 RepID=W5JSU4_ANODA|nr:hypothetical protein AND_000766 [Anopheles darlingi]